MIINNAFSQIHRNNLPRLYRHGAQLFQISDLARWLADEKRNRRQHDYRNEKKNFPDISSPSCISIIWDAMQWKSTHSGVSHSIARH